jgi:glycosyltransferase involved in cell wall biosynthesis
MKALALYVDHTSHFAHNTGIQRCVRATARALFERGMPLQPVVWDRQRGDLAPASAQQRQHLSRFGGPPAAGWCDTAQSDWLLIIELVRGSNNPTAQALRRAADQRGWRVAWVVHDTLPLRWDPEPMRSDHARYLLGLGRFELVLANSRATAQELHQFWARWDLPRPRLLALPLAQELPAATAAHRPAVPNSLLTLLCVSSLEPRKNHRGLLKALAWLLAQGLWAGQLTLVGLGHDPQVVALVRRALAMGLPLQWLQGVDDEALSQLLDTATVCVYPSLEEGFGLPVAEALQRGKPCLCSGKGALGELAAGGGCLTVDTADWRAIAAGLERLLQQPALRQQLVGHALARQPRSWQTYAQELLAALH